MAESTTPHFPTPDPFRKSLLISGIGHVLLVGGITALVYWRANAPSTIVDFDIIQKPTVSTAAKPVEIEKPKPAEKAPERRAVFGISKSTLTSDAASDAPAVKAGNTIAKEQDDKVLDPNDANSLPIPTDEYLVSEMPKLKGEVRIPYPPEAKKANIQGPVLLDLLIDAEGKVRDAQLVRGPGYGLNEAALAAVRGFQFSPAKVQDKPVAVRIRYAYRFILQR